MTAPHTRYLNPAACVINLVKPRSGPRGPASPSWPGYELAQNYYNLPTTVYTASAVPAGDLYQPAVATARSL